MSTQVAPRLLALTSACAVLATLASSTPAPSVHASDFDFEWLGKIELDAEGLDAPDNKERRKAVVALGSYDISITTPYLLKALRDPDQRVRYEAGRILGEHKVVAAVPIVIQWLNEPDSAVKQDAAEILGKLGTSEAINALVRSLGDPDYKVRQRAVIALGTSGTPAVVVPLIGRLDDDKSEVRLDAVAQLEKLGDRRAVIPMVGAFNDASMEVRKAAVRAVGRLGDRAAVPALLRLLQDPTEEIASAAVAALGNLQAVEASDILIEQLDKGGSDSHLSEVAYALGQIAKSPLAGSTAERAVRALVSALERRSLRPAAKEALRNAGAVAVPALIAHLDGELPGDTTTVIELLRDLGDARATPALVAELDRGRISRALVLEALQKSGDGRALVPLLALLQSPDAALRLQAMEALRPIIADLRAADVLIQLLGDPDVELRVLAAEYLGLMRARQAVPRLIELTGADSPARVRAAAVDALGEIADARAADALLGLLADGPGALHTAAANALIYIGDPSRSEALIKLARNPHASGRAHAVRSLGGILRDRPTPAARELCQALVASDDLALSLAAIEALGAMADKASVPALVALTRADVHRSRAAVAALGNIGDRAATPALLEALNAGDDRVSGDAAWALGKLADPRALDALVRATRRRGWATAINASAALAHAAPAAYARSLEGLLHHGEPLVRINAAMGLGRLKAASARNALSKLLAADPSPLVRVAAARALSRLGNADQALERASREDSTEVVREAAALVRRSAFAPPERTDWRNFHVRDPDRAQAPAAQKPYVLIAADGLVTALYTDARGQIIEEQFPPGPYVLQPRSRLAGP